jgi:hypothetical protein
MLQRPSWEANSSSASQEIPRILWNPMVQYCIYKSWPPVPILSQPNVVHASPFRFLKSHCNIVIPSLPGSPKWSPALRSPNQNLVYTSLSPIRASYMARPSHSSWRRTVHVLCKNWRNIDHWTVTWNKLNFKRNQTTVWLMWSFYGRLSLGSCCLKGRDQWDAL